MPEETRLDRKWLEIAKERRTEIQLMKLQLEEITRDNTSLREEITRMKKMPANDVIIHLVENVRDAVRKLNSAIEDASREGLTIELIEDRLEIRTVSGSLKEFTKYRLKVLLDLTQ